VLGAVYEMASAANKGVLVDAANLPVEPAVKGIFDVFDLDPHYCIGAGSMLIAAKKDKAEELINKLKEEEIDATVIGEFTEPIKGVKTVDKAGKLHDIIYPEKDPYWTAFFKAIKQGWK
jgi:hydrogenase maturation factor